MAAPPPPDPNDIYRTDLVNVDRLYGASMWPLNDCSGGLSDTSGHTNGVPINSGDTAWMLCSTALVLFMTPGLAFFYGGLVHRKSVLTIIMQCMISLGTTSVLWFLIGFSLGFGETAGHIIGDPASYPLFLNLDWCTPAGFPMQGATLTIPGLIFAGYQMMFAIISPALITGAFADRVQFPAYLLFISLWLILVYCPFVHWIWNAQGFFFMWGVRDFAGGIVVHISAGFAALSSIFYVGQRRFHSEEERQIAMVPHNRTFVALGAGMLWFGWFGFNGGSALAANSQAVFALVNSSIAAAMAMCVWVGIEWYHVGKPSLVGACVGCVAGLATVTPCAGYIRPWAAFLIGAAAGPVCYFCVEARKMLGWDDALDVWGVHGMGGFLGSILLGALGDNSMGAPRGGVFFGKQVAACVFCAVWTFTISYFLLFFINFITPVLPTEEQIREGLDQSLHGEHAYDEDAIKNILGGALLDKVDHAAGATEEDKIKNIFSQFDKDRNGLLTLQEFKSAVYELGVVVDNKTIDEMLDNADKDRNGSLDYTEFKGLIQDLKGEKAKKEYHKPQEQMVYVQQPLKTSAPPAVPAAVPMHPAAVPMHAPQPQILLAQQLTQPPQPALAAPIQSQQLPVQAQPYMPDPYMLPYGMQQVQPYGTYN